MTTSAPLRKPVSCRFNLHHSWEWAQTTDGQRYIRCGKCLKEKDSGAGGMWTAGVAMGGFGGGGGGGGGAGG